MSYRNFKPVRRPPPAQTIRSDARFFARDINFAIPTRRTLLNTEQKYQLCTHWWAWENVTDARSAWKVLKAFSAYNRNPNWSQCPFDNERFQTLELARKILIERGIAIPV
jgi:hypothetical protein